MEEAALLYNAEISAEVDANKAVAEMCIRDRLSVPAIEFGKLGDKVLLIETQFGELDFVNGYFLMVPELESYDAILSSLGM